MLPTPYGLVTRATLTIKDRDVDLTHLQAVSVERRVEGSNTVADFVLCTRDELWRWLEAAQSGCETREGGFLRGVVATLCAVGGRD